MSDPNGLHLIYLYADSPEEWNCSQWRALTPSDAINYEHDQGRTPHTAQLFHMPTALDWNHPVVQKKIGAGDVLIFQRNVIIPPVWDAMDYWRALHKLVVVDLDDHYADLPPSNPAHKYWTLNAMQLDPDPISGLAEALRHADAVTSPSKVILQDWSHIATGLWLPNWAMQRWYAGLDQKPIGAPDMIVDYESESGSVPNGALQKMEQPNLKIRIRPRENSEGLIMLGWGGSISHVDSWLYSGIIPAIDRLFAKWPQLRLKFCGSETRLNDLVLNRWGDRVIRQSGVAPRDWPLVVSTFDIGLAPLDTRPLDPPWREGAPTASYDERRSWLKACEYLCAGVPWAASRSLTYQDLAQHGSIVSNTAEDWFRVLDYKIDHLAEEKAHAWKQRNWALRKLAFEPNVNKYVSMFERAIALKAGKSGAPLPGVIYIPHPERAAA